MDGDFEDDMRPRMFALAEAGQPFALATIVAADGGPRPVGAQMVVTEDAAWGFLSGGCIEADVALHGREVLQDRAPRRLVYGQGSPFIDMRLPCGGRLDLLVEHVPASDPAVEQLERFAKTRARCRWQSDGRQRRCVGDDDRSAPNFDPIAERVFDPMQRLVVAGGDPFGLAIAAMGAQLGWETLILADQDVAAPPGVTCARGPVRDTLDALALDRWTAVAVATHDLEIDEHILVPALRSPCGYVGVLGSRRRLDERLHRLRMAGVTEPQIGRLRAPIGLPINAQSPLEVAIAVIAEIIAARS